MVTAGIREYDACWTLRCADCITCSRALGLIPPCRIKMGQLTQIGGLSKPQEWDQATHMSEFELCLFQQGAADETPVLPVLGLCFKESELILLATTVASESRERPERRDGREIVRLAKV